MNYRKSEKNDVLIIFAFIRENLASSSLCRKDDYSFRSSIKKKIEEGSIWIASSKEKAEALFQVEEGKERFPLLSFLAVSSPYPQIGKEIISDFLLQKGCLHIDLDSCFSFLPPLLSQLGFSPLPNSLSVYGKTLSMTESLLLFYQKNPRDLPWRRDPSPYHVLISETMLQQTRIEAVKRYYSRFLSQYPTLLCLADSREEDVLKLWEGLGYYSRARNLRKTAIQVRSRYSGLLPSEKKDLLSLPGIGDYTASAILSFAYQKKEVAVDGNLIRVFARLTMSPLVFGSPEIHNACRSFFLPLVPEKDSSSFNQSLMDIGETVCLPNASPKCPSCPLRPVCLASKQGKEASYPVRAVKEKRKEEKRTVFRILYQDRILIEKRPDKGLLAGLYGLPSLPGHLSPKEARSKLQSQGFSLESIRKENSYRFLFSLRTWDLSVYTAVLMEKKEGLFVTEEELSTSYPLPSAFRKALHPGKRVKKKKQETTIEKVR